MKKNIFNRLLFNASIQRKLLLSFGGVVLTFLCVIVINLYEQQHINNLMDDVLQREQKLRLIEETNYDVRKVVDDGAWYIMSSNAQTDDKFLQKFKNSQQAVTSELASLKKISHTQRSLDAINQFKKDWNGFQQRANQAIQTFNDGDQAKAQQLFIQDSVDHLLTALASDTALQKKDIQHYEKSMLAAKKTTWITNIILFLIATSLALLISLLISRRMSGSIKTLRDVTHDIAEGNLKMDPLIVKTGDEVGQLTESTNTMLQSLRALVISINESVQELSASSSQLAASSEQTTESVETVSQAMQQIADGAQEQSQNLEQTQRTMEEIAQGIQTVASTAVSVADNANMMTEQSTQGNEFMNQTVEQMNQVNTFVDQSFTTIDKLNNHSKEIKDIVKVISGIADQTNLLALNAAIEAARAGQDGGGFSVVADEVRKLAQQTQGSTEHIRKLIDAIEYDIHASVEAMQNVKTYVQAGADMVNQSGQSFYKIMEGNQKVSLEIQDLSAVSEEISAGSQEVTHIITQLASLSEQTFAELQNVSGSTEEQNAAMQEVSASAATLSNLASRLQEEVQKFKV